MSHDPTNGYIVNSYIKLRPGEGNWLNERGQPCLDGYAIVPIEEFNVFAGQPENVLAAVHRLQGLTREK